MQNKYYQTVSLPRSLLKEVSRTIKSSYRGYKSMAEFVREAVREKLDKIQVEEEKRRKRGY